MPVALRGGGYVRAVRRHFEGGESDGEASDRSPRQPRPDADGADSTDSDDVEEGGGTAVAST